MRYVLEGLKLVYGEKTLRPYVWKPLLWAAGLFLLIFAGGLAVVVPLMGGWVESWGWDAAIGQWGGAVIWTTIWIFLSGPIFLSINGLLSAFLWEGLAGEIEKHVTGRELGAPATITEGLVDSIYRLPFSLFLALLSFIAGFLLFGIPGLIVVGFIGLFEFTACAMLRRKVNFFGQLSRVFRLKGWFGFVVGAGLASIIPFLNALLLPGLLAGATLMVLESEKEGRVALS